MISFAAAAGGYFGKSGDNQQQKEQEQHQLEKTSLEKGGKILLQNFC
jgi:preprotein translocase subunit YajC